MQHLFHKLQGRQVLITGGAGYIGRIAHYLFESWGCTVWVLDNLSSGNRPLSSVRFLPLALDDESSLRTFFQSHSIDIVLHLAAFIQVEESIHKPELYWKNNVLGTQTLLNAMKGHCNHLLFASSASVYGNHLDIVDEESPCKPTSPYGIGKLAVEQMLLKAQISHISFRLFNVAGAIETTRIDHPFLGEEHNPETHLIPKIIQLHLQDKEFTVFGNQHLTEDGTCIREYVHVYDVVTAFAIGAIQLLETPLRQATFNVSSGQGFSVLSILNAIIEQTSTTVTSPLRYQFGPKRDGDPSVIRSSIEKIQNELGWYPQHSHLKQIVQSSIQHQHHIHSLTKKQA